MLSGIDVNTVQIMLDHVFGRHGICRKLSNAVIFATYSALQTFVFVAEADLI